MFLQHFLPLSYMLTRERDILKIVICMLNFLAGGYKRWNERICVEKCARLHENKQNLPRRNSWMTRSSWFFIVKRFLSLQITYLKIYHLKYSFLNAFNMVESVMTPVRLPFCPRFDIRKYTCNTTRLMHVTELHILNKSVKLRCIYWQQYDQYIYCNSVKQYL